MYPRLKCCLLVAYVLMGIETIHPTRAPSLGDKAYARLSAVKTPRNGSQLVGVTNIVNNKPTAIPAKIARKDRFEGYSFFATPGLSSLHSPEDAPRQQG